MTDSNHSEAQIPVIDISSNNSSAAPQLLDAATEYGFGFIENNHVGIPPSEIAQIFDIAQNFFASPLSEKEDVAISSNKAGKNHGWLGRGIEKLDPAKQQRPDVKEAFNLGEPINNTLQQPLPKSLQPHEQTLISFQNSCHTFCQRILELFAEALSIEKSWFTSRHDRSKGSSGTVFRLIYYPQFPDFEDGVDIRAGAHSDYGSITLLFQLPGQPGLEIRTPEGKWASVPVDPHESRSADGDAGETPLPILVNFGDLLEDWTNGLIRSTVHRVIFPKGAAGSGAGEDRYSMAYFCHPLNDVELVPVPSRLVQEHAGSGGRGRTKDGKIMTAKDHLMERLAATYTIKQ